MVTVSEIMTTELHTLKAGDTLHDARRVMADHRVRHLLIVDAENRLIGLVSQTDVLAATMSQIADVTDRDRSLFESNVTLNHIMKTGLATVDENASLRKAAMRLLQNKIGCLPVVSGDELRGIVTDADFVNVAINLLEQVELGESETPASEEELGEE